ncbi:MAG: hypothetical protein D6798_03340, partial [Deltaproteobacteria bacterium]
KRGEVPLFRAAPRELLVGAVDARWRPADRVDLGITWQGGASWTTVGRSVPEPGRVRWTSSILLVDPDRRPITLRFGWRASLPLLPGVPDTADTGEADVDLLVSLGFDEGGVWLVGTGGLGITGNPLLDGAQDDLPLLWLVAGRRWGALDVELRAGGAVATSRNPGRTGLRLSVEHRGRLLVGAGVGVGTSPAAADLWLGAWTGVSRPCRRPCGD